MQTTCVVSLFPSVYKKIKHFVEFSYKFICIKTEMQKLRTDKLFIGI